MYQTIYLAVDRLFIQSATFRSLFFSTHLSTLHFSRLPLTIVRCFICLPLGFSVYIMSHCNLHKILTEFLPHPLSSRPETSFLWFTSPWKTFKYIIWKNYGCWMISIVLFLLFLLLIAMFIYSFPVSDNKEDSILKLPPIIIFFTVSDTLPSSFRLVTPRYSGFTVLWYSMIISLAFCCYHQVHHRQLY